MAHGSFAPIYIHVKRALRDAREKLALEVLEGYAEFADANGLCYPSPRRVGEMIHRSESTVEKELQKLIEWGLIKVHTSENRLRRGKMQTDYQINPYVIYIREELEAECIALWGDFTDFNENFKNQLNLRHTQPTEPESGIKFRNQNQNQNHNQHQQPPLNRENGLTDSDSPILFPPQFDHGENGKKTHTDNQNSESDSSAKRQQAQREAQTKNPPPVAARPPQSLEVFSIPLADVEHENLAQYLRDHFQTQLRQARALVTEHGYETVTNGVEWVKDAKKKQEIRNPAGLLVSFLRRQVVDAPPPPPQVQTDNGLLSGKYADMFER